MPAATIIKDAPRADNIDPPTYYLRAGNTKVHVPSPLPLSLFPSIVTE